MRKLKAAALVAALSFGIALANVAQAAAPVVSAANEQRQQQQSTAVQAQQEQLRNQVIADLQIQVTALQEEVRLLRGLIEEQDYKIAQMAERNRALYREIDSRLNGGASAPVSDEPVSVNSVPSLPEQASVTEPTVIEPTPAPVEPAKPVKATGKSSQNVEAEQKAYDAIFPLVRNKQYSEAAKAYLDFLNKYPDGRNGANARYWLAQVYYVQGSYEEAETQFKLVMSQHSDSPKASDALLKLGEIEKRRGANAAAKALFQQVVQKYPGSSSAQVAQQRLQELR